MIVRIASGSRGVWVKLGRGGARVLGFVSEILSSFGYERGISDNKLLDATSRHTPCWQPIAP
jgi:hypothetical protein